MENKEKRLVQYLLEHVNQYVTSKNIALVLECSDRTARKYLKNILGDINAIDGSCLISKHGCGYQLNCSDTAVFQKISDLFGLSNINECSNFNSTFNREHFILYRLLFSKENILFDELSEELYISRSTLSNDFKKIREKLNRYGLVVKSKANKGVFIEGTERKKRRFIIDYFYDRNFFSIIDQYVNDDSFRKTLDFEELAIIILEECGEYNLKISDFILQNLVVHISLAVRRIHEGFCINKLSNNFMQDSNVYNVSDRILKRISHLTGIVFPKEEINYVALHLISKSHMKSSCKDILEIDEKIKDELIDYFIKKNTRMSHIFQSDSNLLRGLVSHLKLLLIRLKNQVNLENPLLLEIKEQHSDSFYLSMDLVKNLPILSGFELSDDEIAYISLHIMAGMEKFKEQQKINILVICATGFGSAQMLRSRIHNELGNLVNIINVIGYYELDCESLKNVDAIISTVELENIVLSIPIFTVSVFLNNEEVLLLKDKLLQLHGFGNQEKISLSSEHKPNLKVREIFDKYFSELNFAIFEESIDKEKLIDSMIQRLSFDENIDYSDNMKKSLDKREKLSSVVFNKNIAVPHAIKPLSNYHKISVAIVKPGVSWSEEFSNIKLIFLPSFSKINNEGLKDITRKIVQLTDRYDIQRKLISCENFQQFKELFLEI